MNEAAALYVGKIMHVRLKPFAHRFTYRVFTLLIDIGRLSEADRMSRLLGVNRRALLTFRERDHGDGGDDLSRHIVALLARSGLRLARPRILLLCYPRIAGYVFNPLSVYFCHDGDRLVACVHEVSNTFGDRHLYVVPVGEAEAGLGSLRQERAKRLHVSPFLGMAMNYQFLIEPPTERVKLRIIVSDREGPALVAAFAGARLDLTTRAILALCAAMPFLTVKVIAAIHFEALRLWLKGARYHARPAPPAHASGPDAAPMIAARDEPARTPR